MTDTPHDTTNSINEPWLMEAPEAILLCDPDHPTEQLTASYIWSLQGSERERLVSALFNQYRQGSFREVLETLKLSTEELDKEWVSLKKNVSIGIQGGQLINSNSTGTNVLKHFCADLFYASKGSSKSSLSCEEVFDSDKHLMGILKNRMGYNTSNEGGSKRPYVFAMSNKMLLQGMRSSGKGYMTSTFKPILAKSIYQHLLQGQEQAKVFDFSAGWGARALGAGIIPGLEYHAIDPLTAAHVKSMMKHYEIPGTVYRGGSENIETYDGIIEAGLKNSFSTAWSSPPYFNLEIYSTELSQSTSKFPAYEIWLDQYWSKTVKNVLDIVLAPNGSFAFTMVDKIKKTNIALDMVNACEQQGLVLKEKIPMTASKSHLSKKATTKIVTKSTEHLYILGRK